MLKAYCRFFGHYRSERFRRRADGVWQSRCVSCGTPLVRLDSGQWVEICSPDGQNAMKSAEQILLRPAQDVSAA
jgi:hypothetical protein